MLYRSVRAAWVIIMLGIVFTLALQLIVPSTEVFYNGDSGVKLLLTKQFASGYWGADIRLAAPDWVKELWYQGYYPFAMPFVWYLDGKFVQCFPIYFPMLSAPMYNEFGLRGLYIIPLIATWVIWWRILVVCGDLELPAFETGAALVTTIFCSSVTLYSAMFHEHTLATALAVWGVFETLKTQHRTWQLCWSAILLGFSCWLRPEHLPLAAGVLCIWYVRSRGAGVRAWSVYAVVTSATIGIFLSINRLLYHAWLGAHAFSATHMEDMWSEIVARSVPYTWELAQLLATYFPITIFVLVMCFRRWDPAVDRWVGLSRYLLAVCAVEFLAVPPMVVGVGPGGKQWGPRYIMSVIPLLAVAGACLLAATRSLPERQRWWTRAFFVGLALYGGWLNSIYGWGHLDADYRDRVLPALQIVRASKVQTVVVLDQYIAQEMVSELENKHFFRVNHFREIASLAPSLLAHDEKDFLFIVTLFDQSFAAPPAVVATGTHVKVRCKLLGHYGTYYWIYSCHIDPSADAPAEPTTTLEAPLAGEKP
jgi:hypothetical protein